MIFSKINCESSDRRKEESNLFVYIRPRYICLPSKCVRYLVKVFDFKQSLSWKRVRSWTSLLLRFPAQIETSASRKPSMECVLKYYAKFMWILLEVYITIIALYFHVLLCNITPFLRWPITTFILSLYMFKYFWSRL